MTIPSFLIFSCSSSKGTQSGFYLTERRDEFISGRRIERQVRARIKYLVEVHDPADRIVRRGDQLRCRSSARQGDPAEIRTGEERGEQHRTTSGPSTVRWDRRVARSRKNSRRDEPGDSRSARKSRGDPRKHCLSLGRKTLDITLKIRSPRLHCTRYALNCTSCTQRIKQMFAGRESDGQTI